MEAEQARRRMVDALVEEGLLRDPAVAEAMRAIPRHAFLPPALRGAAYADAPQPIGGGQTISAPHMVALMAQALDVQPGHRVLEVGGGSGYHAAVLGHLAGPAGRVVSVEYVPDLARSARAALASLRLQVEVEVGDGSLGWPPGAPFDRISVAAAAPAIPPPLVDQLAPGGLLLVPAGPRDLSSLLRVRRTPEGALQTEDLGPCLFVPLLGKHGWPG
jgi:protein-L-isoaspartate(D-aspartate) O-methyltransferase